MSEFRRISEYEDPLEILGAPMETSLIDQDLEWPSQWASSHGSALTSGELIELTLNFRPEEIETLSNEERNEKFVEFDGLIGSFAKHLPEEKRTPGSAIVTSVFRRSAVGKLPCAVAKQIEGRLARKFSLPFSVSLERIGAAEDRGLQIGDLVELMVELPEGTSQEIAGKFEGLLGSRIVRLEIPGVSLISSVLEKEAVGRRPCELALLLEERLADELGCSFAVSVDRWSDLSKYVTDQIDTSAKQRELFDRYRAALRIFVDECEPGAQISPCELEFRLSNSSMERHLAWRAVCAVFPGADIETAMTKLEGDLIEKFEASSQARQKFSYLSYALSQGYRPIAAPDLLTAAGDPSVIPAPFAKAAAEKVLSPDTETPDIDTKLAGSTNRTDRDYMPNFRGRGQLAKAIAKRSKHRWPTLMFHAVSQNIYDEIRNSKAARDKGRVPPRRIFRRFSRLAYREFCNAYDQVMIFDRVPVRTGANGQWMIAD